ncbi:hypothetical protein GTZ99_14425 [Novosphingobium sp. FSY-8]|uniref:Uncharacterized protein n=1 Tax=Novosphingobium ovatum TaxID=1908523 RepID=A0ABW9XH04_9SPHN|nr:hypothetical protein [Novosphingobium ovatum]NBC37748.1 hypothetical protein [Novosphingobium ovatum]
MKFQFRVETRPESADTENCRRLSPSELDSFGNPLAPITIEVITQAGTDNRYWIAYAEDLPGYFGDGETPIVALSRLHAAYSRKPIFRTTVRRYSEKSHNAWIERWIEANKAIAKLRNSSSLAVTDVAKEYGIGKSLLQIRYTKMINFAESLIKDGTFSGYDLPYVMKELTGQACSDTAIMALRATWADKPKHKVIQMWAIERFLGLDGH